MTDTDLTALAVQSSRSAMATAAEYLRQQNYVPRDYDRATDILRTHCKTAIGPALEDVKQAVAAGMTGVIVPTFLASMRLAGIAGAKEIIAQAV